MTNNEKYAEHRDSCLYCRSVDSQVPYARRCLTGIELVRAAEKERKENVKGGKQ